ncbi:MAG: glycosyltransferase family 4 protein [Halobacteriota archaeon]
MSLNFVSSFPPRQCGIATFTSDLAASISNEPDRTKWSVTVVKECQKLFLSNASLRQQAAQLSKKDFVRSNRIISRTFNVIKDCDVNSFVSAATKINNSNIDVVNIQHEFGLYRGDFGSYILEFMRRVRKPIVTTMHTILPNPPPGMRDVVRDIYALSDRVVTSANAGIELLNNIYGLNKKKLELIPHGVPAVPLIDTALPKRRLGLSGKFVIASYGLMNPDKGIESVIEALPSVIDANPNEEIVYMVVGEPHPALDEKVRQRYKGKLDDLIKKLGLAKNVVFVQRYLSNKEMIAYFLATDICTVTNTNPNQISSGVLSQAIGCGKSVVATQFTHATEVLLDGRGLLVKFDSPEDLTEKINLLISDTQLRKAMSRQVHEYAQSITWERIARMYLAVFRQTRAPLQPTASTPVSTLENRVSHGGVGRRSIR